VRKGILNRMNRYIVTEDIIEQLRAERNQYREAFELKEKERKDWADMCIKKQARIEELEGQNNGLHDKLQEWININVTQSTRIKTLEDGLRKLANQQPYPEDVFLPITQIELAVIHMMLQKEFDMPLDRLAGHIGRVLRTGISEQIKQLLNQQP
jgi:hypothetical protein